MSWIYFRICIHITGHISNSQVYFWVIINCANSELGVKKTYFVPLGIFHSWDKITEISILYFKERISYSLK